MPGRKYGAVVFAKTPPAYHAMTKAEQAKAGKAIEQALKAYAGKVDIVRHYWTSVASSDISDVVIMEADEPIDLHGFQEELERLLVKASGGDASKFGATVDLVFGINPDAEPPKRGRARK